MRTATVVTIPLREPLQKPYSIDIVSSTDINGMVLIEGCIPRAAYIKLEAMLRLKDY